RRRHTRFSRDWSSDVCSSDLARDHARCAAHAGGHRARHPAARLGVRGVRARLPVRRAKPHARAVAAARASGAARDAAPEREGGGPRTLALHDLRTPFEDAGELEAQAAVGAGWRAEIGLEHALPEDRPELDLWSDRRHAALAALEREMQRNAEVAARRVKMIRDWAAEQNAILQRRAEHLYERLVQQARAYPY